jgi:hypothetical protein
MFKIDSFSQSKSYDTNKTLYYFYTRNFLTKISNESFSKNTSRNNAKRTIEKLINEKAKINLKDSTFYQLKQYPPVYFYRKIERPYKYNISSVPEYLTKTNEEKHFMEKLNQLIGNEGDRIKFNNLINKKEKERRFKDRYKPSFFNVQTVLKYKPNLYSNSFNFDNRSKSVIPKDNLFFRDNNVEEKTEKNEKKAKIDDTGKNNNNNNIVKNGENNHIKISKEESGKKKKDEISEEDQIKYKYKLSDIFNFRNEKVITNKSAEKYLFNSKSQRNIINNNDFYISSQSQSDWIPNRSVGEKMNSFSSVSYNIISPLYKGYNKFISPSELKKNNKYNESTAFRRVKSISEFIDLTRVSASNTLECFNKNKKLPNFKFKANVATNQLDEYHINRDLIYRPI